MPITADGWLAERFGHSVWTVSGEPSAAVLEHAAANPGRALYQAKVDVGDVATVLDLARAGLVVVNVNSLLERAPAGPAEDPPPGIELRELEAGDTEIAEVAQRTFSRTRFHLDPRIPDEVADLIKRAWVESYLSGVRGELAYVALRDGRPVGFLAVVATERERVIDLMGVDPGARGAGVGRALVRHFVAESAGRCQAVRVGTQAANPGATRFYEDAGFRAAGAAYDLHRLEG